MTDKITPYMRSDGVMAEFQEVLGHSANAFVSSVLITVANDERLQKCTPASIYVAAMKAANIGLSVGPELGHAYLVAYKNKGILEASFQPSYRGLKQLAMSTGQYRYINSSPIYEGEYVTEDRVSGFHKLEGNKAGDKVEGWLAAFELVSGYGKTFYMTVDEIHAHALKCNPGGYNSATGTWKRYKRGDKNNIMEQKTPLRLLLMRDGYLTPAQASILQEETEVIDVIPEDVTAEQEVEEQTEQETERPYTPEVVKQRIAEKVKYYTGQQTRSITINDRKVLASILDGVLIDVTKRHELCNWLVGEASTSKMNQADAAALFYWLGTDKTYNAIPGDDVIKEIHSAHTAALKASGQLELI